MAMKNALLSGTSVRVIDVIYALSSHG